MNEDLHLLDNFTRDEAFVSTVFIVPGAADEGLSIATEKGVLADPVSPFLLPLRKVVQIDVGKLTMILGVLGASGSEAGVLLLLFRQILSHMVDKDGVVMQMGAPEH